MPVPPPTLPSATGPDCAASSVAFHVLRLHVKAVHVVEHTVIGFRDERIGEPDCAMSGEKYLLRFIQPSAASRTTPTLPVLVIRIGVSRKPDSWTQCVPVMSPLPFST